MTPKTASPRLPTWREMHMDTTPDIEAILFQRYREMPAWQKMSLLADLNRSARELALSGLRRRHPNATPEELKRRLADMILGEELAAKAYGPLP